MQVEEAPHESKNPRALPPVINLNVKNNQFKNLTEAPHQGQVENNCRLFEWTGMKPEQKYWIEEIVTRKNCAFSL